MEKKNKVLKYLLFILIVLIFVAAVVLGLRAYNKSKNGTDTADESQIIMDASEYVEAGTIVKMSYEQDASVTNEDGSHGFVYYVTIEGDHDGDPETEPLYRKVAVPQDLYFQLNIGDYYDTLDPYFNVKPADEDVAGDMPVVEAEAADGTEPSDAEIAEGDVEIDTSLVDDAPLTDSGNPDVMLIDGADGEVEAPADGQ